MAEWPTLSEKKGGVEALAATRIIRLQMQMPAPQNNKELYGFNHGAIAPPASFVDHFVRDVSPIEVGPV